MRSKLFVPASRPEFFAKAFGGDADAVCFDLEDAVEERQKPAARAALTNLLERTSPNHDKTIVVRVNAADTGHLPADLDASVRACVDVLNLPVVESVDVVRDVVRSIEHLEVQRGIERPIGVLLNIETARGLRLAASLAGAHPRIVGLQIGYADLFSPHGIEQDSIDAKLHVRIAVRLAAGESGLPAYDGAFLRIDDPEGFTREANSARSLGFSGKSCIHPSQVPLANQAFRPRAEEIEHAIRVVEASREAENRGVGAFVVDGRLVDLPLIIRAESTLAIARRLRLLPE